MVQYASDIICMFMNINEDIENKRENIEKCKECANKISYISDARYSILPTWYQINAKA